MPNIGLLPFMSATVKYMGKKKMKREKKIQKFEIHCSQWILKIASINQFKRFDRRDLKTYKECYIVGSMTAQRSTANAI